MNNKKKITKYGKTSYKGLGVITTLPRRVKFVRFEKLEMLPWVRVRVLLKELTWQISVAPKSSISR